MHVSILFVWLLEHLIICRVCNSVPAEELLCLRAKTNGSFGSGGKPLSPILSAWHSSAASGKRLQRLKINTQQTDLIHRYIPTLQNCVEVITRGILQSRRVSTSNAHSRSVSSYLIQICLPSKLAEDLEQCFSNSLTPMLSNSNGIYLNGQ